MIIVGSKALNYYFPEISRNVNDVDIIGSDDDIKYLTSSLNPERIKSTPYLTTLISIKNKSEIFDKENVEILNYSNSDSLFKYVEYSNAFSGLVYAPLEVLYSLKKSHIHFPIKFEKHINDYCLLNNHFNSIDILSNITKLNFKETENRMGKLKTPSLNKTVKDFFGQSNGFVESYFIHDDIHKAMSHYETPLYEKMQTNPDIAKCDKNMWNNFSFTDKCKTVLEEAYVIALERKVLPGLFGGKSWTSSEDAILFSLRRICTTLCSGWFREFATNNYTKIVDLHNKDYVGLFLEKYNNGEIKRILK